ncbi:hypothetical protein J4207_06605 [Candidatus Woesearchaeota archaeon]|nr:hypothetical protein [Candidatus Woesearchaeota archaeon]HLC80642.1 hypothetical protein [Candidatus Nanoarchaeia archaeon]
MSLEKLLKRIPVGLAALFLSCGSGDGQGGEKCSSDFDCKGNRICVYGQCADSSSNESRNNGNQYKDAFGYQPQQNYDAIEPASADISLVNCNKNCNSSCNPSCSSLLYDDFNTSSSLWEGDSFDVSGGVGGYSISASLGGDCSKYVKSVYSYSLENFKKFRLQARIKGENDASPNIELEGGNSWGNNILSCMYNYINPQTPPNIGLVCNVESGIILEYPTQKNAEWHDIEMEWFGDGSVIVNFDGATAGYLSSIHPPGGNYNVFLACNCLGIATGKCFFDYIILTREN